ncbi:MAG TPA: hypothetical protein VFZ00_28405 [Solirubrobacter sp.]|nr:hypothetical protein [Solirubrobacter sp.]
MSDLVPEDLAEQRAHDALDARDDRRGRPLPTFDELEAGLVELFDGEYMLRRLGARSYVVITVDGDSGTGETPAEALDDLLARL